jgi:adenosylhomocysteine nucleosidase
MTVPGRRLVVAALREELAGLEARLGARATARAGDLIILSGTLAGRAVTVASTGDGPIRAARGLAALLAATEPAELWVVGLGGGLSPGLELADLVASAEVREGARGEPVRAPLPLPSGLTPGTVVTLDRIVSLARDKRSVWEEAGCPAPAVVDLESAAYVRVATAAGVPWCVVRAVSDPTEEDLPLDFESFRDEEGGLQRSRIARHAAMRPAVLRQLLRLRTVVASCAERLADALEADLSESGSGPGSGSGSGPGSGSARGSRREASV